MREATKREYALLISLITLCTLAIVALEVHTPTGQVIVVPPEQVNATYTTPLVSLVCTATADDELTTMTLQVIDDELYQNTTIAMVAGTQVTHTFELTVPNGDYHYTCTACTLTTCEESPTQHFTAEYTITEPQNEPVLHLSFDNEDFPWKDESNLNHHFSAISVTRKDSEDCKWYGCADFRATGADTLQSSALFSTDKLALSFWVYHTQPPDDDSQAYYALGEEQNLRWTQQGHYGYTTSWQAQGGEVSDSIGSSHNSDAGVWEQLFIMYDGASIQTWIDAELVSEKPISSGTLRSSLGDAITIGEGLYGINTIGYIDEFIVWNRANFTDEDIAALYEEQRLGTPPQRDLLVENVTYTLPYEWDDNNNLDMSGSLPIAITIANKGVSSAANNFQTRVSIDSTTICTHTTSLQPSSSETFTCNWPQQQGWHSGTITVDSGHAVSEDDETNNDHLIIIPLENHPRFRFTQEEWDETLKPWFTDSANSIGHSSYNAFKSFISEDFNPSWSASNVDPRAKKGFENAIGCYLNNYAPSEQCTRAMNHLDGWLVQVDDWQDASVQALHETIHVAAIYDLMFPTLTQEQAELYGRKLHDLCLATYGKSNVQPHNDGDEISPGNGWGFGSGMAAPCYVAIGDYENNPTMMWTDPQDYNQKNTIYYWTKRMEQHIKGFKADAEGVYPEGMLYFWYSKYHLVDNLWFLKRTGLSDITERYQDDICSWTKEAARNLLDHTYDGSELRNDEHNTWRQVSFGDANSYEEIGSDGVHGWDVITIFGLLCDDPDVKAAALTLRTLGYTTGEQLTSPGGLYYVPRLASQTQIVEDIGEVLPAVSFARNFDRLTIRRGYTYEEDDVFIIDAGDQRGSGHPNAEFDLFSYVNGEPFLDYPQVPYEDDVRTEVWHNTISFSQSEVAGYNEDPTTPVLNQYYGDKDVEPTGTYPDIMYMPDGTRGDVEDTIGTERAEFAAAHAWKPYTTATTPVVRDYVLLGDLLVHADTVDRSVSGPIYANWINIFDEFPFTKNGNILTFTRAGTNKKYTITPIWSTGIVTLSGGDSGKQYCFVKTDCSNGGDGNYGKYYHEVQGPSATTIFVHHWYQQSPKATLHTYEGNDHGVIADYGDHAATIIFDTDKSGSIEEMGYTTNGWSLVVNGTSVGATGTTSLRDSLQLFTAENAASVYLTQGLSALTATISVSEQTDIVLRAGTVSTAYLDGGQLLPQDYTVTGQNFQISLPTGNHHLTITHAGDSPPLASLTTPLAGTRSLSHSITFACTAFDDHHLASITLLVNGTSVTTHTTTLATDTLSTEQTLADGTYSWACKATDNSSQITTTGARILYVGEHLTPPQVSLITPDDQASVSTPIRFRCSANDDDLAALSLWTTLSGQWENTYTVNAQSTSASLDWMIASSELGPSIWGCSARDDSGLTTRSANRSITLVIDLSLPSSEGFDGLTTDFAQLSSLYNQSNITLENSSSGALTFTEDISFLGGIDFPSAVGITRNRISVDSSLYPQLDVAADLVFYNTGLDSPVILLDGDECTDCSDPVKEGEDVRVSVQHFSTYELVEKPASQSGGGGGGGGGGGISSPTPPVIVTRPEQEPPEEVQENGQPANEISQPQEETIVIEEPLIIPESRESFFGRHEGILNVVLIIVVLVVVLLLILHSRHESIRVASPLKNLDEATRHELSEQIRVALEKKKK